MDVPARSASTIRYERCDCIAGVHGRDATVHAQNDPTIEVCTQYAEANVVFETAKAEAGNAYDADVQEVRAARRDAEAARNAAIEDALNILIQTYLAIYAEDGGTQSDVWDAMVKLLNHQRNRCTKLYGL